MIKANELRIGNWFRHKNTFCKEEMQFEYEFLKLGELVGDEFPQFDPIPLTAEILHSIEGSASGFTSDPQQPNPSLSYMIGNVCIHQPQERANNFYFFADDVDVEIKSLHQLQNLYFALTGIELNVTL